MNDDIKSANEGHLLLFRDYIGDKKTTEKRRKQLSLARSPTGDCISEIWGSKALLFSYDI